MNRVKWIVAVPVAIALAISAGTYGYIHFINGDQPAKLTLDSATSADSGTATTAGAPPAPGSVDGTWKVGAGSQAGYRVKEVLFGQSAAAVGRTTQVTGEFALSGTRIASGSFTVDLASVQSSEDRRDGQFRGRIMNVARYPTAKFVLTKPIELPSLGADGSVVKANATGDLTIKDVTKSVTIPIEAQRVGTTIKVAGAEDLVFADWHIDNPSGGPATTENHGQLEFLLVFTR
jgi:polyisoprenoid-binding protein YceI